jgi:glutamyl-tRNA(Gln) amidotransferase subunit D
MTPSKKNANKPSPAPKKKPAVKPQPRPKPKPKPAVPVKKKSAAAAAAEAELYKGYRGAALECLKRFRVKVWSDVVVDSSRGRFEGRILPRAESGDDQHIVIKIVTGYNVGVAVPTITGIRETGYTVAHYKIPEKQFPFTKGKPFVKLLGTGGTIASRLDYRTGAVIPAFTPGELYGAVPELADICNLETEKFFGVFSENMGAHEYVALAKAVAAAIEKGVDGIVIGHGTDTMHHTAAVLSFMVQESPVPIVLAALNLIHAVKTAAESDLAEVMVCMFGPTSDLYGLLHRGTRVRKMHSSYRSTFRTIGDVPLATVDREKVTPLRRDYAHRRDDRRCKLNTAFESRVALVYYYPNMDRDIIDALVDRGYRGIVIAGTGLGHMNKPCYPALQRAQEAGIAVYMTVQTLWGYVHMDVYETGRDMQRLGVIPGENMLPEVAYIKLCWALGQTDDPAEVKRIMLTSFAGEITPREPTNGYIILQGGLPEVEDFISGHWK